MPIIRQKVYAYIFHQDRLLVFSHPDEPEAGIQVPGGSIEPGEEPAVAAMREAFEETGLVGLQLVQLLGETDFDMQRYGRDEIHHRFFFQLACQAEPPERWYHSELYSSDGSGPHRFELFWVRFPDEVPELLAGMGACIGEVLL